MPTFRTKPRGPAALLPLDERPKSFADFAPSGGGDQVKLVRFAQGRRGQPLDVTGAGLDVWRPAVAVDGDGSVVVVWSEHHDGNWDLYSRSYQPAPQTWSDRKRLTTNPGTDTDAVSRHRSRRPRLDGLASVGRRPGRHLARPGRQQHVLP